MIKSIRNYVNACSSRFVFMEDSFWDPATLSRSRQYLEVLSIPSLAGEPEGRNPVYEEGWDQMTAEQLDEIPNIPELIRAYFKSTLLPKEQCTTNCKIHQTGIRSLSLTLDPSISCLSFDPCTCHLEFEEGEKAASEEAIRRIIEIPEVTILLSYSLPVDSHQLAWKLQVRRIILKGLVDEAWNEAYSKLQMTIRSPVYGRSPIWIHDFAFPCEVMIYKVHQAWKALNARGASTEEIARAYLDVLVSQLPDGFLDAIKGRPWAIEAKAAADHYSAHFTAALAAADKGIAPTIERSILIKQWTAGTYCMA